MKCFVCESVSPKYKCPYCRISYCSVKCWRTHRDDQCQKTVKETSPQAARETSSLEFYNFPTHDTIPPETLKLLEHSQGVRDTLYNPHVRNILEQIDKADNPSSILEDAMREPIFVQFVEECMKVVEPRKEYTSDSD